MNSIISRCLNKDDLLEIKAAIIRAEAKTSGEIRVIVTEKSSSDMGNDARGYAIQEFYREGLHETREGTGVLIIVFLAAKKFEIVADQGINSKIAEEEWQKLGARMLNYFEAYDVKRGIMIAIQEIGNRLTTHFPHKIDDVNELPDDVVVEE